MKLKKNKDNKETKETKPIEKTPKKQGKSVVGKGLRNLKELMAPTFIDRTDPTYLRVGDKFVKSYTINGYPHLVQIGWLNGFYSSSSDIDVAIYITPAETREALNEINKKISQYESQLIAEKQAGRITNLTRLENLINPLYEQRERLELNQDGMFYAEFYMNYYANSKEEMDKGNEVLESNSKSSGIGLTSLDLRQDEGYKSALPYGKSYVTDAPRNFSSGAVASCFPFYNSEICHPNGVFIGANLNTRTPVFIDFYDRKLLQSSNFTVFGTSGSGKTYFVSLLTLRSILKGIRTVIIDPEGEYVNLARTLGGSHILISQNSEDRINPFDIEEEEELDKNGRPTGRKTVNIREKAADVLNLISVMAKGIDNELVSLSSMVISDLYASFGITEDPESLYEKKSTFENGKMIHGSFKKRMPTMSDFHKALTRKAKELNHPGLMSLAQTLTMFTKGNIYDMFDCETNAMIDFGNTPLIVFDVSQLEENILRPIGMYIALSWTWEKFVKKKSDYFKRVVVDEAWMFLNRSMAGFEYTSHFLEVSARRIRKRNAGLLVASQSFKEFANSPEGQAVIQNSSLNIFLRQHPNDLKPLQEVFHLSNGEIDFLRTCNTGELLIRSADGKETTTVAATSFEMENSIIVNNQK